MQEEPFRAWLRDVRRQAEGSIATRLADCRLVEKHEGDLDDHWNADGLRKLLDRLTYSKEDERNGKSPRHNVPTEGDLYNNSATFKAAANLYRKFLDANGGAGSRGSDANHERWEQYLDEVRRYVESGLLDSEEVEYKLEIGRWLKEARRAVLAGAEARLDLVSKAINSNLTSTYDKIDFRNWFRDHEREAMDALRELWSPQQLSLADRIRAFLPRLPTRHRGGAGTRLRPVAVLLMGIDVHRYPPFKVTEFNTTYDRLGYPRPDPKADEASLYEHSLGLLNELLDRARRAGLERPRDRLEAQSVLFAVAGGRGAPHSRPCWFVGASFGGTDDQTERFLAEGVWEHGHREKYVGLVQSMEPGDRIAIKAWHVQKHGLPFDYEGGTAACMTIKAIGEVTKNVGDGRRVLVDWTRLPEPRIWYFYTYPRTVWRVVSGKGAVPWAADALIRFTFEGDEQDYDRFLSSEWSLDDPEDSSNEESPPSDGPQRSALSDTSLGSLADELLYDRTDLQTIAHLLDDKRQVIFQGPPGTGKTYAARALARFLAESDERVTLVQFHPSYAYEDFVQGYRPTLTDEGQATFALRDGPLVQTAKKAKDQPHSPHFLIIDEINRGNLAKVFGELYFLLEYRDEDMTLQYARDRDEPFSLPENLYIIGTMNTADRSIALVDLALRRRFHFVEFHPDKPPVAGLLERWLKRDAEDMAWVVDLVKRANAKLDDRQAAIGPTYFMKKDLSEEKVRLIWEHNVLPYIEEHLYGETDRLAEFDLEKLRHGPASEDAATDSPGQDATTELDGAGDDESGDDAHS